MSYYTIFISIMLVIAIIFNKNIIATKRRRYFYFSVLVLVGAVTEFIVGAENCFFTIIELGVYLLLLTFVVKMIIIAKKIYQINMAEWILIGIFIILSYVFAKTNPNIFEIRWITISIASTFIYLKMCKMEQSIDGLTKLLNQNNFKNYNPKKKCIIIIFDVNNFKYINDTYGHPFGDEVLITVANILMETYKKYGKCYRIGGDEFAVILENKLHYLDKLNSEFIENIQKKRNEMEQLPNISYGCSMFVPKVSTFEENIKYADAEMYKNKKKQKSK